MHELVDRMYKELKKEHTKEEVDALVRGYLLEKSNCIAKKIYNFELVYPVPETKVMIDINKILCIE